MYWNVLIICVNVFEWIYSIFECIYSIFIDIVFRISSSYSYCIIFSIFTHLHIFFLLTTMTTFLYYYILFSHFHWFVSTFIQFIKKLHINPYFSRLYITPHSTFHVVTSCVEHSGAQEYFRRCSAIGIEFTNVMNNCLTWWMNHK
jgi:hypothetical protein